jgi:hypothetical protein
MLRLPATSIAVSENDLSALLQHMDVYQGLLKQGFKKTDVLRYFREHQAATQNDIDPTLLQPLRARSTVELTQQAVNVSQSSSETTDPSSQSNDDDAPSDPTNVGEQSDNHATQHDHHLSSRSRTTSDHQHAPCRSSLLRFGQASSPPRMDDDQNIPTRAARRLPIRTYRPRTDTYSYDQSEASADDEETQESPPIPTRSSFMRPEAEAFVPASERALRELQQVQRSTNATRAQLSSPDMENSTDAGPETPDNSRSAEDSDEDSHLTATPIRQVTPNNRSERHQLDGTVHGAFQVYDDALPPHTQPQTPADVGHRQPFADITAAYTAPPGMIHSPTRILRQGPRDTDDEGTQTPTVRAIHLRQRRTRELARGLRAEGARIARDDSGPEEQELRHAWRDELEVDRAGDENWDLDTEDDDEASAIEMIRVLSGNARA